MFALECKIIKNPRTAQMIWNIIEKKIADRWHNKSKRGCLADRPNHHPSKGVIDIDYKDSKYEKDWYILWVINRHDG